MHPCECSSRPVSLPTSTWALGRGRRRARNRDSEQVSLPRSSGREGGPTTSNESTTPDQTSGYLVARPSPAVRTRYPRGRGAQGALGKEDLLQTAEHGQVQGIGVRDQGSAEYVLCLEHPRRGRGRPAGTTPVGPASQACHARPPGADSTRAQDLEGRVWMAYCRNRLAGLPRSRAAGSSLSCRFVCYARNTLSSLAPALVEHSP